MASALVLRIKFPQTYPIIYKTVRIDSNMSVKDAVPYIAESVHVPYSADIGLFLPDDKMWLDDSKTLSEYSQLTAEGLEYIEFKSRNDKSGGSSGGGGGGCCTLL